VLRAARGLPEYRKKSKQRYGTLFKMDFLLLAPLQSGNIASSTKCIAYLKLAVFSRGIALLLFM